MIVATICGVVTSAAELDADGLRCRFEMVARTHTSEGFQRKVRLRCLLGGKRSVPLASVLVPGRRATIVGGLSTIVDGRAAVLECSVQSIDVEVAASRLRRALPETPPDPKTEALGL